MFRGGEGVANSFAALRHVSYGRGVSPRPCLSHCALLTREGQERVPFHVGARTPVDLVGISADEWRLYTTISRLNWGFVAAVLIATFGTASLSRLKLSIDFVPLPIDLAMAFGLLALNYTYLRHDPLVAILSNTIALTVAINFSAGLFSYTAQFWGASLPLRDAVLARLNSLIGFHWVAWFAWLNQHLLLASVMRTAYISSRDGRPCCRCAQFAGAFPPSFLSATGTES